MSSKLLEKLLDSGDVVLEEYSTVLFQGDEINVSKDYHTCETVIEISAAQALELQEEYEIAESIHPGTYLIHTQRSGSYYTDYDYQYIVKRVETYEVMQPVLKWKVIKEEE